MSNTLDMFRDINKEIKVETHRSGHFVFQIGVDMDAIQPLIERAEDAHQRFDSVPKLPEIAVKLQHSIVVSSVFGTNTIEGGTLSEEEISALFTETPKPETIREEKERRVLNIRNAYDYAEDLAQNLEKDGHVIAGERGVAFTISEDLIKRLHCLITDGLNHKRNVPGKYRDNEKGFLTRVGDADHGGVYKPPKCLDDVEMLMKYFVTWINSDPICELHPLIRAPLAHYYFERIHPFWDGNGRVGRVLEAIVLKCSGMRYAPFALARTYLEHIDEYFTVFNVSRKSEERKEDFPNTAFVRFFLNRLREVFNQLHDYVNGMIGLILYENNLNYCYQNKEINDRQFQTISKLLDMGLEHNLSEIQSRPWYKALYSKVTRRTRDRDVKKLVELGFISPPEDHRFRLLVP